MPPVGERAGERRQELAGFIILKLNARAARARTRARDGRLSAVNLVNSD
jgi:hypothetical protein